MTELRRELIKLYAKGKVEEVHNSADYQQLCLLHTGDRAFDGERFKVEELRSRVDDFLGRGDSYKGQVEFGLRLLWMLRTPRQQEGTLETSADQEACTELILQSYGERWEPNHREYFKKKSNMIMEARQYFLSFTNRNPGKPNLNQVNRNHQFFIIDSLGPKAYAEPNLSERNLLAEAINHLLRNDAQLDGFYYPKHEEDNTNVEKKLRENCLQCIAFVQLAQGEMFRYYEGAPNWCFFEFNVAHNAEAEHAEHILFVQIDDQIQRDDIHVRFVPWYEAFAAKDAIKLKRTRWHEQNDIEENFKKISTRLAEEIRRAKNRIYLQIPN
jgi:hypothetical protein